jgi:hypothetical protein
MRILWSTVVALALVGCGARVVLDGAGSTGDAGAGGSPVETAVFAASCAPTDGPAILLTITPGVECSAPEASTGGLQILISGAALGELQAGATLTIGSSPTAPVQGAEIIETTAGGKTVLTVAEGSVVLTSFVAMAAATGSYQVTFVDGSTAQGGFSAVWCPGPSTCG